MKSYTLIDEIIKPVVEGYKITCSYCEQEPDYIVTFADGHIEPRCAGHKAEAARPERHQP